MKQIIALLMLLPLVAYSQSWQYTGSMHTERWLCESIALENAALIVGGNDGSINPLSSCEIYDPNTGTWSLTGSLNIARAYPTLIKLSNGHILSMSGGISFGNAASTKIVEDYDPSTGTWSEAGSLKINRFVPTATLLDNGTILVVGGMDEYGTTLTSSEIFNPAIGTSSMTGSLSVPRYCAQATLLNDGKVLITGGRNGGAYSSYISECELFDPSTGAWSIVASMNQERTMGVLAHFSDNTVLVAGGRNSPTSLATGSEVFDPTTMTWSTTSGIKEPIHWTAGIAFPDDRFMATGGIIDGSLVDNLGLEDITTSKCEWYDRSLTQWYYAPELNTSRCRHGAVYLHQTSNPDIPSEFLLVAGGQMGSATLDSSGVHNYTPGFTNTAEILDVSQPALKQYMASAANAAVRPNSKAPSTFKAIYLADASLKLTYTCQGEGGVSIDVMSIDGRQVEHVSNAPSGSGQHQFTLQTNSFANGSYFVRFVSATENQIFKFVVAR